MGNAKVVYFGTTLIDLTGDTVDASHLLAGYTAHGADGEPITGTNTFDSDTSDADALAAEILDQKTAYVNGAKVEGTMPNNGGTGVTISTLTDVAIPQGYTDGSAKAAISATEKAKIIPENIRQGVTILGVQGSMSGSEGVVAQTKTAVPSNVAQTILPDTGYTHLSQVTVAAIPYTETTHASGGKVITIG